MAAPISTDPALVGAFAIFRDESRAFFAMAERQLSARAPNYKYLHNGFHKIKGGAGFFGLDQLCQAAALAQESAARQKLSELEGLIGALSHLRQLFEHACVNNGDAHE